MLRTLALSALALATSSALARAQQPHRNPAAPRQTHTFAADGDHFTLDGKPFKILSGELHYARIPREYWHARLKMARAMGLNTIATYVFWNIHEPTPGRYDFAGNNDLAAFVRAAQEEGLYVILRSGPYACAEWDLGGLPAWLLADPASAQAIRTNSPLFLAPAQRWVNRLAQEVLPLQLGRGGPILMTQIENEYGQFGDDHTYIASLHDIYTHAGFNGTDSLLYTADNWRHIPEGSIPQLFASVNFGINNHQHGMDNLATARPGQALFVSEYWPGWFDHWGHPHETRPIAPQIADIDYILHRGAGINIYMFHGGTSFGFYAGSSYIKDKFLPDVTSYDYDAPLDESGRPTPKYFAYRKELARFSPCGNESCLPAVPTVPPPIAIPALQLTRSASLWNNLPQPVASPLPAPMEHFGQSFGYILYRTQVPAGIHGNLTVKDVHDVASIYLHGKLLGTLDRRDAAPDGSLPPLHVDTNAPAELDILVANDGRVNVDHTMRTETKGITQSTLIDGHPLSNWQVYPLPMTSLPAQYAALPASLGGEVENALYSQLALQLPQVRASNISFEHCGFAYGNTCPTIVYSESQSQSQIAALKSEAAYRPVSSEQPTSTKADPQPTFFQATFTLTTPADTFLDTSRLGRGVAWINGHNLGRFWNAGPQQTLYVPGPWLRSGTNDLVLFDMLPVANESVRGLDHPILDAPVANSTRSQQE